MSNKKFTIKALTLFDPWATLVAIMAKRIETRSWMTKYRGPVLIHVSKKYSRADAALAETDAFRGAFIECAPRCSKWLMDSGEVQGKIICITSIVDCVQLTPEILNELEKRRERMPGNYTDWEQEKAFGDYSEGRYGFVLGAPYRVDVPMAAKGNRMLWNYEPPAEFTKELKMMLEWMK